MNDVKIRNNIRRLIVDNDITIFSSNCYASFFREYFELQHTGPSGSWFWKNFIIPCSTDQSAFFKSFLTSDYKVEVNDGMTSFSFKNGEVIYFNHYKSKTPNEISSIYDRRIKRVNGNRKIIITSMESQLGYTIEDIEKFVNKCKNAIVITDLKCTIDRVISIPEWQQYLKNGQIHFYSVGLRFYDFISQDRLVEFYNEIIEIILTLLCQDNKDHNIKNLVSRKLFKLKFSRKVDMILVLNNGKREVIFNDMNIEINVPINKNAKYYFISGSKVHYLENVKYLYL